MLLEHKIVTSRDGISGSRPFTTTVATEFDGTLEDNEELQERSDELVDAIDGLFTKDVTILRVVTGPVLPEGTKRTAAHKPFIVHYNRPGLRGAEENATPSNITLNVAVNRKRGDYSILPLRGALLEADFVPDGDGYRLVTPGLTSIAGAVPALLAEFNDWANSHAMRVISRDATSGAVTATDVTKLGIAGIGFRQVTSKRKTIEALRKELAEREIEENTNLLRELLEGANISAPNAALIAQVAEILALFWALYQILPAPAKAAFLANPFVKTAMVVAGFIPRGPNN
jgi:hypothetical protein